MRKLFLILVLLCALFASAHAQTRSYTYGGSGHDILYDAAVSTDGRIVLTGTTDSADGTLAERTRAIRCGWALCIDTQGNVLWNYTTRRGSYDTLRYPVFLEDGRVAMLLDTSHNGLYEVQWILLDQDGNEIERWSLISRSMPWVVRSWGVLDAYSSCYVVRCMIKKTTEEEYLVYELRAYGDEGPVDITTPTEEPYYPSPMLPDGTRITIENDQDVPLDVTVTFASSSYTLRVTSDESIAALLYNAPDENSTPIGQCLPGTQVTLLDSIDGSEKWMHVTIEGYEGYMLADVFEPADFLP